MGKRYIYRHRCAREECRALFESTHKESRFCSRECYHETMRVRTTLTCEYCGSKFKVIPSEDFTRYCSRECYLNAIKKLESAEKIDAVGDAILNLDNAFDFLYPIDSRKCNKCGKMLQNGEATCLKCELKESKGE